MSVWVCMPSKRPPEEAEPVFAKWKRQGYKIALWVDGVEHALQVDGRMADRVIVSAYPGYARAVNELVAHVVSHDAEWIVAAADDIEPDLNHTAEEIAEQCWQYFWRTPGHTFGVMQPTGDRWGDAQGAYIDRVAGSPWLGREFCKRINQGRGPLWPEYFHMGEDEELQAVAIKYGVFWQRPDLIHLHKHWGRPRGNERVAPADRMPEFLREANSPEHWAKYKKLFAERKAAGFPGSEPL